VQQLTRSNPSLNLHYALIGYALLDPIAGWNHVRDLARNSDSEFIVRYGCLRAARYFYQTHRGVVSSSDSLGLVASLLEQADICDLPIEDLRRWKRWEYVGRVLALDRGGDFAHPIIARAIVRFALQCPDKQAAAYVAAEREKDPARVMEIEEVLKESEARP
jgi:hypothetical protein